MRPPGGDERQARDSRPAEGFARAQTRLRAVLAAACEREPGWPGGVDAAVAEALELSASEPALMRALTVDVFDQGLAGVLRYRRLVGELAARLARARTQAGAAAPLAPRIEDEDALIVAAVDAIAAALRAGREAELPARGAELTELLLGPQAGRGRPGQRR